MMVNTRRKLKGIACLSYLGVSLSVCLYVCMSVCLSVCLCVCVCVCVCARAHAFVRVCGEGWGKIWDGVQWGARNLLITIKKRIHTRKVKWSEGQTRLIELSSTVTTAEVLCLLLSSSSSS